MLKFLNGSSDQNYEAQIHKHSKGAELNFLHYFIYMVYSWIWIFNCGCLELLFLFLHYCFRSLCTCSIFTVPQKTSELAEVFFPLHISTSLLAIYPSILYKSQRSIVWDVLPYLVPLGKSDMTMGKDWCCPKMSICHMSGPRFIGKSLEGLNFNIFFKKFTCYSLYNVLFCTKLVDILYILI